MVLEDRLNLHPGDRIELRDLDVGRVYVHEGVFLERSGHYLVVKPRRLRGREPTPMYFRAGDVAVRRRRLPYPPHVFNPLLSWVRNGARLRVRFGHWSGHSDISVYWEWHHDAVGRTVWWGRTDWDGGVSRWHYASKWVGPLCMGVVSLR